MIRVLHTIDTTGPGGAETIFINLVKGLDGGCFQSFAAIQGPGWVCDTLLDNGVEPFFVPSRGRFNIHYLRSLVNIIRQCEIDIVHSHLLGSNLYCSLAGLICRIPVISTFHGFVDTSDKERLMTFKSLLINIGSRKIVFVSDRLREQYVKDYGFSSKKSVTIYNGVDTTVFFPKKDDSIRKELGLGDEHILIGAVGNIRPAKGYDLFLKAARIIHDKYPECRFIIAGQGAGDLYEALLQLRKDLDLEKIFFFLGFRGDAAIVFNNLDIFVLPSVSEGFSISTIEAMACGLPLVVTRSGGPEEILLQGDVGKLVEAGVQTGLVSAIISLCRNCLLDVTFSYAGVRLVEEKFSANAMINNYQVLYQVAVSR